MFVRISKLLFPLAHAPACRWLISIPWRKRELVVKMINKHTSPHQHCEHNQSNQPPTGRLLPGLMVTVRWNRRPLAFRQGRWERRRRRCLGFLTDAMPALRTKTLRPFLAAGLAGRHKGSIMAQTPQSAIQCDPIVAPAHSEAETPNGNIREPPPTLHPVVLANRSHPDWALLSHSTNPDLPRQAIAHDTSPGTTRTRSRACRAIPTRSRDNCLPSRRLNRALRPANDLPVVRNSHFWPSMLRRWKKPFWS